MPAPNKYFDKSEISAISEILASEQSHSGKHKHEIKVVVEDKDLMAQVNLSRDMSEQESQEREQKHQERDRINDCDTNSNGSAREAASAKKQLLAFNKSNKKYQLLKNKNIKKIKQKDGVESSRLQSPRSSEFTTPRKFDFKAKGDRKSLDSAELVDNEPVSESPMQEQGVSNNKRNTMQLFSHVRLGKTQLPSNILEL